MMDPTIPNEAYIYLFLAVCMFLLSMPLAIYLLYVTIPVLPGSKARREIKAFFTKHEELFESLPTFSEYTELPPGGVQDATLMTQDGEFYSVGFGGVRQQWMAVLKAKENLNW